MLNVLSQLQSVPAEALIQADHAASLSKRANTAPEDLFKTSLTTKMTTDTKISDLKLAWKENGQALAIALYLIGC